MVAPALPLPLPGIALVDVPVIDSRGSCSTAPPVNLDAA
jgi:hypothetical protein